MKKKNINWSLRSAIIDKAGTQVEFAKEVGIREPRLSYIINSHVSPTLQERRVLAKALGRDYFEGEGLSRHESAT